MEACSYIGRLIINHAPRIGDALKRFVDGPCFSPFPFRNNSQGAVVSVWFEGETGEGERDGLSAEDKNNRGGGGWRGCQCVGFSLQNIM